MFASQDGRMVEALAPYVNALKYRIGLVQTNALRRAEGVPTTAEMESTADQVFGFMKERWLWENMPDSHVESKARAVPGRKWTL